MRNSVFFKKRFRVLWHPVWCQVRQVCVHCSFILSLWSLSWNPVQSSSNSPAFLFLTLDSTWVILGASMFQFHYMAVFDLSPSFWHLALYCWPCLGNSLTLLHHINLVSSLPPSCFLISPFGLWLSCSPSMSNSLFKWGMQPPPSPSPPAASLTCLQCSQFTQNV